RDGHVTGVQTCALPISRRLFVEDEPRSSNWIAADVHERPATSLRYVADVACVAIEITEHTNDRAKLADSPGPDQFTRPQPLRMRSEERRVGKECRARWR